MSDEMLAVLARLDDEASPGPWYVRMLNDDVCMSAVAVSTSPPDWHADLARKERPSEQMVAGCLIQEPDYIGPADGRWDENAELIAAMRNALPELLRLARIGIDSEKQADVRA